MARDIKVAAADNGTVVSGSYAHAVRQVCIREVEDLSNPFEFLGADEQRRAEINAEIERKGVALANQRLREGRSVVAMWYMLPRPLPPPLDTIGTVGGPRSAPVTADDVITPGP